MKRWHGILALLLVFCLLLPMGCGKSTEAPRDMEPYYDRAETVLTAFCEEDYGAITALFDATMQQTLGTERLAEAYEGIKKTKGAFVKEVARASEVQEDYVVVVLTCLHENGYLDLRVVFDGEKRISGLQLLESKGPKDTTPPPQGVLEKEVSFGTEAYPLKGTLSYPESAQEPVPVVVLVHGSGPCDRDESVGPTRPFRDIAWGLGQRGIAVLRYDKRTYTYATACAVEVAADRFTVREETMDDALLAVEYARHLTEFTPGPVYLLGHSLGAMLVPRMAEEADAAGYIMLAAPAQPLEDLILMQYTYLLSLDTATPQVEKDAQLASVCAQVENIKRLEPGDHQMNKDLLGMNPAYLLDLKEYDPVTAAVAMTQPLLILQGGRDYQVPLSDFETYQKALAGRKNVTCVSYEKLNHLFCEGEGERSIPQEYIAGGSVPDYVIDEIASFIRNH